MPGTYSRRTFVGAGAGLLSALAGCMDLVSDDDEEEPEPDPDDAPAVPELPRVEDPPDAVYVPTHREAMIHLPVVEAGEYALSPMLTYPHRFWIVTGERTEEVVPEDRRGVHLMATLWDRETGQVLPVDAGAEMRVLLDGDVVDQRAPWPMISQSMGFHFGDNVPLPEDGTYTVEFDLSPITVRKTGGFVDRFEEHVTASFQFDYDEQFRRQVVDDVEYLDEELWGERGALEPMEHGGHGDSHDHGSHDDHDNHNEHDDDHGEHAMPFSSLPHADAYPGRALGEPESGDATFVVRYLEESRLADGDDYLLVSPRTPYNRVPLADMALSVEGALEAPLEQTLDDELGLHYGTAADLEVGDEFTLVVESPPQVSRHAGYETAFLEMPPMEVVVTE